MSSFIIHNCPGTLLDGHETYSTTCLRRMFVGKKVSHILPYDSPATNKDTDDAFIENQKRISISGVQEKFSVVLDKFRLRLITDGERGGYILKPISNFGKNLDQMPANEHLTMQIARQVFGLETAENALIFFKNDAPAYITKRFDVSENGDRLAIEDFASLAGRTPQTHGKNYKYEGNYLELFELMKKYIPAYMIEAPKLFNLLVFNYLFSNGDAHFKNFSIIETPLGDFKLSPAYDLLNTRIHIKDSNFALSDGLLPKKLSKGNIVVQFKTLANLVGISDKKANAILNGLLDKPDKIAALVNASFLNDKTKRNYLQAYQTRRNRMLRNIS